MQKESSQSVMTVQAKPLEDLDCTMQVEIMQSHRLLGCILKVDLKILADELNVRCKEEEPRMAARFLAGVTGRIEWDFTEIKQIVERAVLEQKEFSWRHVNFQMLFKYSSRDIH